MTDPYQVLGIAPTATDEEVKAAYRSLAKRYHPDRNNGSAEAEQKMMQVNEAYAQIMDMRKNGGRAAQSGAGYGGSQSGYYGSGQARQSAPGMEAVRSCLAYGRYMEALQLLENAGVRNAEWYYLAARARQGLGDDIAALNYARQAANMEPGNFEYVSFVNELSADGQQYRQQGVEFGGMQNLCRNPLWTCCLLNMCCGGRFCFFPCC